MGWRWGTTGWKRCPGRGSLGVVYVGVHRGLQQRRAVKVLPPQLALDEFFALIQERSR